MASHIGTRTWIRRTAPLAAALTALAITAACGSDASGGSGGDDKVSVALITKDSINPFFVTMQEGAKQAAKENNVDLTVGAGKEDGDEEGQIQLIENAIAAGDDGILITPNGPGVNTAIKKARDAGLYVIALDTPPDPADTVDITFATDNFKAGELIGQWAAKSMAGEDVVIAMLDLFDDKVVSVDYNRDQGFLTGMGIDVKDKAKNGDEAPTGSYSGGSYTIACNEPTNGAQPDGKTAMERCLAKNPNINLVYSINEPAGIGASEALAAAGKKATIVSVDGGCLGVSKVADGTLAATSQQYPIKMAQLGVEAIAKIARGGEKPETSPGLDFFDTGTALVTDKAADGVESITSDEASKICWGTIG
jgi:fructose transport system substrate-binding protein